MDKMLNLKGWIPCRVYWDDDEPMVDWCFAGEVRFTAPFMEETLEKLLSRPFNTVFRHQTPISVLSDWAAASPGLEPSGFIFHLSRCGSTLICQQLAALERNIVLSEPAPVDTALNATIFHPQVSDSQRIAWMRGLVSAYLQHGADRQHGYIKFDSWHTIYLPLIRQAYPNVPFIFLYRDPGEILVSQMRMPGMQMIRGSATGVALGFDLTTALEMPIEDYFANVLARTCSAVLDSYDGSVRLVNFAELPEFTWTTLPKLFNYDLSESERELMVKASRRDAKQPNVEFESDTKRKQSELSGRLREASETIVQPLYLQLELLREQQSQIG